jgi:lipoprotein-anchoring transpeptidase ErfK/SrfK
MSTTKYLTIGFGAVFVVIGVIGWLKKAPENLAEKPTQNQNVAIQEISMTPPKPVPLSPPSPVPAASLVRDVAEVNRIAELFALGSSKLPIVETISYTSRVPWLKGRPAWIADYAAYYETSRHFIARSLNKKPDYLTQKVGPGDRFNVFRKDKKIQFHLLVDLSCNQMKFYYIDLDTQEKVLLKTYRVGTGRLASERKSGSLTPVGTYALGNKVAIYKPGVMGIFQDQKTEMMRVFGTRWIPFEKEVEGCSEPAKGLGIHGTPWILDSVSGQLVEDRSQIGKSISDGCIRLSAEDIEELFAILITKPTTIEIVERSPQ